MIGFALVLALISAILSTTLGATTPTVSTDLTMNDLADIIGGDAVCVSARRQVTATLIAASRDLRSIGTAGARSTAVRATLRQALEGMKNATTGLTQAAFTLLGGDQPSKESKELIANGFESIKAALDAIARSPLLRWPRG
ncbi:hypothetical protein NMY22_g16301 [Coprinellus aureogranulatus]|nr:hypothetical protein NMY22_g16301 [Coprinellus aureogranulatus]